MNLSWEDHSKGVVFYVDDESHGLAVSLNQEKKLEDDTNYVYGQDIVNIPNEMLPNGETWNINVKGECRRCPKLALRIYAWALRMF